MNSPPTQPKSPGGSFLPLLLAFILASAVIGTLSILTLGFVGVIVAVVACMAAFIGLQYLLWGWWLGQAIRDESEAEDVDS